MLTDCKVTVKKDEQMVFVFNNQKANKYSEMKLSYQGRMWCAVDVMINGTDWRIFLRIYINIKA